MPCPYCGDGMSYPERYVSALLTQLKISFRREYTVRFQKEGKNGHYKYDFYDEERNLLIEVHGLQHFVPGVFSRVGGSPLEVIQQRDREKEQFAREVLRLQYVNLDCRESEAEWIRTEVIKKLDCYPLEKINWEQVRQDANASLTLRMVELYQQGCTQKEIGEILHVHSATVCQKLKKAAEDGVFDGKSPRKIQAEKKRKLPTEKGRQGEAAKSQPGKRRAAKESTKEQKAYEEYWKQEGIPIEALDPYVNTRTVLRFRCRQCGQEFKGSPNWLMKNKVCPYCEKTREIQKRIAEKYGDQFQIQSIYVDCKTPLVMYHQVCEEKFQMTYTDFMKRGKQGCPVCGKRSRGIHSAKTRRERSAAVFYEVLPQLEARGYTLEGGKFTGMGKPHPFRCHHCGEIWRTTPSAVMKGRNHICISHCKKKTPEEFRNQVKSLVGEEYTVLSDYQNAFTPVKMRHNVCGREYPVAPEKFTSGGRRCPACRTKFKRTDGI